MTVPAFTVQELSELEKSPCWPCGGEGTVTARHSTSGSWRFPCPQCRGWGSVYRRRSLHIIPIPDDALARSSV